MAYKCVVANLSSENPSAVTFTKTGNFPTEAQAWEEVVIDGNYFAKFKIHYRKSIFSGSELVGFEISDTKEDADFVPYDCFLDEQGRELEYILIGRYYLSSTSEASSVDAARVTMKIGIARSLCRARGTGYQQMDAAMQMFWRDLALACSEKVDFNNGAGVATYLGLARMTEGGWWIDGLTHVDSTYLYCLKPSKYVDSPTASTDGYSALSYAMPTANGCITKLGYDANHPTINYPSANNGSTSAFTIYYCDGSYYASGNRPCIVSVGRAYANAGLFYLGGHNDWSYAYGVRLCYRPEYVPPAPTGGGMSLGNLPIEKVYLGTTEIIKLAFGNITIYEASTPPGPTTYTIGFTGMSQSTPALTRTGEAVGATWASSGGIISIDGIDISKIWGGYVGNDGEELTFDASTRKFMHNGSEYTGNVFSKINRFFVKPIYESNVLDGFELVFTDNNPDPTQYQDWFLGKPYAIFGCYKTKNVTASSPLVSKQGITYSSSVNANDIVAAYKLNSSTAFNLHEKWYNENAIMQVLFMAIFATRKTEDVFPQGTYRRYNDNQATGICDTIRGQSLFGYTTSGSSGADSNLFLGLEDFVGFGYELVAGVKLSGTNIQSSLDYVNFAYSNTYSNADVNISAITSGNYIKSLQLSANYQGLLVPATDTGDSSVATDYFCDNCWHGQNCWYQGAYRPRASYGVFYFSSDSDASYSDGYYAGRLCGNPV